MSLISAPLRQDIKIYVNDLSFIDFNKFETWHYFCGYAYDIKPSEIEKALILLQEKRVHDLVFQEINFDWQDAQRLSESNLIPESIKHCIRIAMLYKLIPIKGVSPVNIDIFSRSHSKLEGHHRVLAQKLLGYRTFPAYMSGMTHELKHLVE